MKLPNTVVPLIYGAEALVPLTKEVCDLLTKEDKYGEAYLMYRTDTKDSPNAWVPRGLVNRQDCAKDNQYLSFAPTAKTTAIKLPQTEDQAKCIAQSIALMLHDTDHVLEAPTGWGKSHPFGTKVVLFDGSVKQVQDITVADTLIGPDSLPRTVYGVHKSLSPIYLITPTKGEPFECNDVHILSLKSTYYFQKNGAGGGGRMRGGEIVNISVLDYLKTSKNFKHLHKLWRAPAVEFVAQPVFDPYVVGLYLADGQQDNTARVCCGVEKMAALDYLESVVPVTHKYFERGAWYYTIPSFYSLATTLTKGKARVIPSVYLQNSVAVRLQLLAGLLDGDGYLFKNCFEIACKDEQFKDQVLFLCRSLGLAAYATLTEKSIKSTGFTGMYWVIKISGDTDKIPTKIPKKQADARGQIKDALVTGFKVEYVRDDWVYGFGLDADHLYLLNDFTVTHNTYAGISIAGSIGQKTLIVVTKNDLIKGWRDTLIHLFGVDPNKIGHVQQDQCKYKGCNFVIAMIHSLVCREYDPEFYQYFGLTIFDESGSKDTFVTTSKGQIRFDDLVRNKIECDALSFNTSSNEYEWKPILAYHEHPPKNPMMRITHEQGYLDFTSEHLFYTDRGWIPVRGLVAGDNLYLDSLHSIHYNNSEQSENKHGSMATGDGVGGREYVSIKGRAEGTTEIQSFKQTIGVSAGEIPETKGFCANPTKAIGEWWLGGREPVIHNHHADVVSTLLPKHILQGRAQVTPAINCRHRVSGITCVVDDGRWNLHRRVFGIGLEQIPRAGREGAGRPIYAEWLRQLRSGLQRLVHHVFSGIQQAVEAGTNAILYTEYAVQVGGCSLRWPGLPVHSVRGRHSGTRRWTTPFLLQEGGVPESQEVHELPSRVHSSIGASQAKSRYMGPKTRVLSITALPEQELVYDIEVADNHNFVANGVLVHNCHRLGADYFAQACKKFPTALRLGLSATPKRGDGKEKLFEAHIGPVMVKGTWVPMAPKILVKQTGWKVPVVNQRDDLDGCWKKMPMKITPGRMMAVTKAIAASKDRNIEIARFVKSAFDAGRTIVVMSDLIDDHLTPLFHFIVKEGVPGDRIGFYHGSIKKEELIVNGNTKAVILATFSMMSEGTNLPRLDTLVLATPRANVKQAVGRILRLVEGKKQPVVLDLVDDHSVLKAFYYSRLRQYFSVGGEVVEV